MMAAQKGESPAVTGQTQDQSTENATVAPAEKVGNNEKRAATLKARAALAGVALHAIKGDDGPLYILTRWHHWHLTRELRTLDDVEAWLNLLTGVRT